MGVEFEDRGIVGIGQGSVGKCQEVVWMVISGGFFFSLRASLSLAWSRLEDQSLSPSSGFGVDTLCAVNLIYLTCACMRNACYHSC